MDDVTPRRLLAQGKRYTRPRCRKCGRGGRYALARLEPDVGLPFFFATISRDCPKRRAFSIYDLCDIVDAELDPRQGA